MDVLATGAWRGMIFALICIVAGCGPDSGSTDIQLMGRDALSRLPAEVAPIISENATLRFEEIRHDGNYKLWILHLPGGDWLRFEGKPFRKLEHHNMPASALVGILGSRLPSLNRGMPTSSHCRLTHWRLADGAEIQIREMLFDQGWFASIERVAM